MKISYKFSSRPRTSALLFSFADYFLFNAYLSESEIKFSSAVVLGMFLASKVKISYKFSSRPRTTALLIFFADSFVFNTHLSESEIKFSSAVVLGRFLP